MLSDSSQLTNSHTSQDPNGGNIVSNFMNSIFGNDASDLVTTIALEALKDNRIEIAGYVLTAARSKGVEPNFSKTCDGKTLMHYLVQYSDNNAAEQYILNTRCESRNNVDCNIQDRDGNTPAHYALMMGKHNLVCFFEMLGCDLNIANKDGIKIARDTTYVSPVPDISIASSPQNVFAKQQGNIGSHNDPNVTTLDFDSKGVRERINQGIHTDVNPQTDVDNKAIAQKLIASVANRSNTQQARPQAGGSRIGGSRKMLAFSEAPDRETDTLDRVERISHMIKKR